MKGSLKDLNEIPPSGLIDAFARNIETIPHTLHETFVEGLRQRLPNGLQTQEQYQEQKSGAGAGYARAEKGKASPTEQQPPSGHLVEIARRILKITPNQPIESLVDAFQYTIRHESPSASCARAEAVAALNVALAEQRLA